MPLGARDVIKPLVVRLVAVSIPREKNRVGIVTIRYQSHVEPRMVQCLTKVSKNLV